MNLGTFLFSFSLPFVYFEKYLYIIMIFDLVIYFNLGGEIIFRHIIFIHLYFLKAIIFTVKSHLENFDYLSLFFVLNLKIHIRKVLFKILLISQVGIIFRILFLSLNFVFFFLLWLFRILVGHFDGSPTLLTIIFFLFWFFTGWSWYMLMWNCSIYHIFIRILFDEGPDRPLTMTSSDRLLDRLLTLFPNTYFVFWFWIGWGDVW